MITRRSFLRTASAASAACGVAGFAPVFGADTRAGKSMVFVGKGGAGEVIPKIIDKMGGIGRFVKKKSRVVIKPNMSFANPPEWATTTSPEAVSALIRLCLDAGARRVIVCDNTLRIAEECRKKTGIEEAVGRFKRAVLFTPSLDAHFEERTSDKATDLTRVSIVREVLRADALISVPIAKSHSAPGVSLGIKGLMGLVKERSAYHRDMDLHMAIAEQLYYFTPTLTVVDASRALINNGPSGPGTVKELNTFVGGIDPVAVDSYAVTLASWYGRSFEGRQVRYLKNAADLGFGRVESSRISETAV